jgi:hypothetical protein
VEVVEHRNVIRSYPNQKVVYCNGIKLFSIQCAQTFIVGFTVACAAACIATLRLFLRAAAAVFHNLIYSLAFERLFSAVHIWLDGDSPAGRTAVPVM